MNDPIAILPLDTRAHGPANCEVCDEELEDVFLTTAGEFVCTACGAPLPGFMEVSNLFCSARILTAVEIAQFRTTEWKAGTTPGSAGR